MLPPSSEDTPVCVSMWWTSAVVVDLPFVPVMPTTRCCGSDRRARANSSMSPMTGTPALLAAAASGTSARAAVDPRVDDRVIIRSEEHTSELQSLMRISYAVFCLKKKKHQQQLTYENSHSTR